MKILMISGSPRVKGSTSVYLLKALKEKLEKENEVVLYETSKTGERDILSKIAGDIKNSDAIVLAFPLYVDGIPSHLLGILSGMEKLETVNQNIKIYQIVNNGFYDAEQNSIAVDMIWNWCDKCRMQKGCSLCVGGGEMSQAAPLGHGPSANLGKNLDRFAAVIAAKESGESVFTEPNFPRFLYRTAAHINWQNQARKNGLKAAELKRS